MNVDIEKLKKMTTLANKKIKKIHTSSYNSSLLGHPSELAEVRTVLNIASKTLTGKKIYFENMIEKAGFSSFHLSDTLDVLEHILDLVEITNQTTKRRKIKRAVSDEKSNYKKTENQKSGLRRKIILSKLRGCRPRQVY